MNRLDEEFVYHGSPENFDIVIPKRQLRSKTDRDGNHQIIFNEVCFHATPYKWIALAYTYDPKPYEIDGRRSQYNMGVNLYQDDQLVVIMGFETLEGSLQKLYGDGGYLFVFKRDQFFHTQGLGNLEVITKDNLKSTEVIRIDDPVDELRKLGAAFRFLNLSKPENSRFRNYRQ